MVLKWKNALGKWVVLYGSAILNRLRCDKNLSDVNNKAEARKNLELVNEVTTHYHDKRYNPKFEQLDGKIDSSVKNINDTLKNEYVDNAKLEKAVSDLKKYTAETASSSSTSMGSMLKSVQDLIVKEKQERTAYDGKQDTRLDSLEKRIQNIHIGPSAPSNPINNYTIWFCTANGSSSVRVYSGNTWKLLGAGWES